VPATENFGIRFRTLIGREKTSEFVEAVRVIVEAVRVLGEYL
jgi:hypothetical protein